MFVCDTLNLRLLNVSRKELKTLWEKEKMLVNFSNNVFKSFFQGRVKFRLCCKGLKHPVELWVMSLDYGLIYDCQWE